ncbi:RagB/SusD family nutrient uptake outer membrane protein [Pedobacter metabolipauper]|uniref:SusD-like starch-binding protein associating with outer membrane n=1 Tax=Pedobacter metabolipauper TaxID=425513 RepID=A0A4V3D180_9SPHI|nr:RagB/SusD family nutrient uptake outer membrane protein [Pedobacter metabolipauper]TDQ09497.1 SusD-like starch-binding protein associating with outer membrane [Pedobacter metabolipauper]
MKKTYKVAIYSAIILLAGLGGCKKEFLEVSPNDSINKNDAFSSPEKIAAALTGLYDATTLSSYTNDMILNNDVKGGDVLVVSGAGNYGRFITGYQFIEAPSGTGSNESIAYWTQAYAIIRNANEFQLNIPAAPLTDALKTRYIAETRAIRADAYFWLVRWYCKPYTLDPQAMGVPVVRMPLAYTDATPDRGTVQSVYDLILEDLLFAEINLPASNTNIYRMTKNSIRGLLARVYLTMGNYPEASKYAKLARVGFPLSSGEDLLTGFNNPTSEWIFGLSVRSDDNQGFLGVHSFYDPYDIGYSSFRVNDAFLASFSEDDIRKQQFLVDGEYSRRGTEGYLINKFDFNSTPANNQVLIRSSEMYLIEAEAEARQGVANEPAAKAALLAIQARAGITTVPSLNTGQALINEILVERGKELYGEGHKFFDLLRTKTPITRATGVGHWAIVNFQPGDNKLVLPLPIVELNANPVLKPQQNPGYAN